MSWVAVAIVGSTVVGGLLQSNATQNAANTQANATTNAQNQLLATGQTASQQFAPYTNYGATPLSSLTANNPYFNQQFTAQDLQSNLAPNYEFMKNEGLGATSQNINVGGGGSNVNMARTKFAEDYASNAYQNAFNNFQTQRGNIANIDLANSTLGLSGATGSANAQLGTGTNIASLTSGQGNASAASQIAQGNIWGNVANTAGSMGAFSLMNQGGGGGNAVASLGSQNWNAPTIGGGGNYTNMGGSGSGIGGFVPA